MKILRALVLFAIIASMKSVNIATFGVEKSTMSKENKQFISNVISKYGSGKHGCVLLFINEISADYGDYISSTISSLNSSSYIINFHRNKDAMLTVSN